MTLNLNYSSNNYKQYSLIQCILIHLPMIMKISLALFYEITYNLLKKMELQHTPL